MRRGLGREGEAASGWVDVVDGFCLRTRVVRGSSSLHVSKCGWAERRTGRADVDRATSRSEAIFSIQSKMYPAEMYPAAKTPFFRRILDATLSEAAVPAGEAESRPQPRKRHQKRLQRQSGNARKASKGPGRAEGSPRQAKEGTLGPESGGRT